jgi:2-keto-3-deoxy-L-rhamnonate aldolase RhmA
MADDTLGAYSLKRRIHAGETVYGISVPMTVDKGKLQATVERGGYDFVSVDSQHSPYNEDRLVSFCGMAGEIGVHVQFRIKHTRHSYLIGNYLDLGPTGIEVPQVEEESTVDESVAFFYYPQRGIRSWGGAPRAGFEARSDRLEYAAWWAETGVLWMQLESVGSVTNARALAKAGVDCVSFGPADLGFSLEAHPGHHLKTVDDCVRHVVEQLRDTTAAVCFRSGPPENRQKYADMGVTVLLESAL